jgi:hypothetical protein
MAVVRIGSARGPSKAREVAERERMGVGPHAHLNKED